MKASSYRGCIVFPMKYDCHPERWVYHGDFANQIKRDKIFGKPRKFKIAIKLQVGPSVVEFIDINTKDAIGIDKLTTVIRSSVIDFFDSIQAEYPDAEIDLNKSEVRLGLV